MIKKYNLQMFERVIIDLHRKQLNEAKQDYCMFYIPSRTQRINELEAGLGLQGTLTYSHRGCYNCEGIDEDCKYFFNKEHLLNKIRNIDGM